MALLASHAWAAGTPAGTQIPNTAVISYTYNGTPATQFASAIPVVVARVLSVRTTWQDSTPAPVNSPDAIRPLTFAVTNTGNGTDTFALWRDNALAGDQFDPLDAPAGAIWLESGAQPGFQATGPNADIPYLPGTNDPVLAADASRIAYLASNIPPGFTTGAMARASLQARSSQVPPGTPPGTQVGVQNGIASIVGANGAFSAAPGIYLVSVVAVGIGKSVVAIADPAGGQRVMTGAVLTYRLQVTATGNGTANNIVVADPLPATLTFVPGSITVDGIARTDGADGDDSSFSAGTVRTVLPSLTAPQTRAIEFKATVN
nr:DUF11 domain-containing protein [Ramlibacter algicola]